MKLIWSPEACVDLREMVLYIADKNPYAARALYERIEIVAAYLLIPHTSVDPAGYPALVSWSS